jgi:SNF2 family DNA or RNA helicase
MLKATTQLLPFQKEGTEFLQARGSGLLAFDVGLGKTVTSVAAIEADSTAKKILVLVPASLKFQWQDELEKFVDSPSVSVITGTPKERTEAWKKDAKYYIANYELLLPYRWKTVKSEDEDTPDYKYKVATHDFPIISAVDWDYIVADEATKISNPNATCVKGIKLLKSRHRFALTGTPISNRPDELWSIIDWVSPKYLGSYWSFLNRYTVKNIFHGIAGYRNLDQLAIKVKPFVLKKSKEEVLPDLPEKRVITVPVELSTKENQVYQTIKKELWEDLPKDVGIGSIAAAQHTLVKLLKLRLCVDSLALLPPEDTKLAKAPESAKFEALETILEELDGQPVIIFTEFSKMADILAEKLKSYKITGSVNAEIRNEIVQGFNRGENSILVMTRAGSLGLNLQAAKAVVHYDQPWSLAQKIQREGRAHRMGQKDMVLIYNLLARKSVDEWMVKKLHKKQEMSDKVLMSDVKELLEYE